MYKIDKDGFYELEDEVKSRTYEYKASVTAEQIESIIVAAAEGGIGHWAIIDNSSNLFDKRPEKLALSYYINQLLLEGKAIDLLDVEDNSELGQLTLTNLLKGISYYAQDPECSLDPDCIDSEAANIIIQYALFGDVVYD